jgi:hypothetical protein
MTDKIKILRRDILEMEDLLQFMRKEQKVFTFKAYDILYRQVMKWKIELAELECKHETNLLNQIISN